MVERTRLEGLEAAMAGHSFEAELLAECASRIERETDTREMVALWISQGIDGVPVMRTIEGVGGGR